jgi:hypothetical protein
LDAGAAIPGADSSFDLTVDGAWIHIGATLRCNGKSVNCGIKGMIETMVEGLDAFWNEFRVLAGFMGSAWSKLDSFEEEDQSKEGCRGVFGGRTKGGITAGGKSYDAKEREVTIMGGMFGMGGQLAVEGITEGWGRIWHCGEASH